MILGGTRARFGVEAGAVARGHHETDHLDKRFLSGEGET